MDIQLQILCKEEYLLVAAMEMNTAVLAAVVVQDTTAVEAEEDIPAVLAVV